MMKKKCFLYNGEIYLTYLEHAIPPDAYVIEVDEDVTIDKLKVVDGKIEFKTEQDYLEETRNKIIGKILKACQNLITKKLKENGYYSLGDLFIYAQSGSQEAVELLSWYKQFDAKVWDFIETELAQKSLQELESFNIDNFLNNIATEVGNV